MRVPKLKLPAPNRVALYLTSLAGLGAAVAPVVADLDLTSTIGVIGGLAAILGVVRKWLEGWQAHEEREAFPPVLPPPPVVEQDEPGDVLPGLPHLATTSPTRVPQDKGDSGASA